MTEPNWRALCAELLEALEHEWIGDRRAEPEIAIRARSALAAEPQGEGPALPPGYIDVEHTGADRDMLEVFYSACRGEGGTADEIHLRGIRAVLSRYGHQPALPAEGEVGELVLSLRETAAKLDDDCYHASARIMRSAATLLQQLSAPACVVLKPSPELIEAFQELVQQGCTAGQG